MASLMTGSVPMLNGRARYNRLYNFIGSAALGCDLESGLLLPVL